MAVSETQKEFIRDLFAPLGPITMRSMMGGLCIYSDGQIFAILGTEDRIFIRAKGDLADAMAAAGAEKFSYTNKDGKTGSMGYWTLPESALDDPDAATEWARRSLLASAETD